MRCGWLHKAVMPSEAARLKGQMRRRCVWRERESGGGMGTHEASELDVSEAEDGEDVRLEEAEINGVKVSRSVRKVAEQRGLRRAFRGDDEGLCR